MHLRGRGIIHLPFPYNTDSGIPKMTKETLPPEPFSSS